MPMIIILMFAATVTAVGVCLDIYYDSPALFTFYGYSTGLVFMSVVMPYLIKRN